VKRDREPHRLVVIRYLGLQRCDALAGLSPAPPGTASFLRKSKQHECVHPTLEHPRATYGGAGTGLGLHTQRGRRPGAAVSAVRHLRSASDESRRSACGAPPDAPPHRRGAPLARC
jgi:hypothetical protein